MAHFRGHLGENMAMLYVIFASVSLVATRAESSWYVGCYYGNTLTSDSEEVTNLAADPVSCSKACFERGYELTGVSHVCMCMSQLPEGEANATLCHSGCVSPMLPCGAEGELFSMYQSRGPYLLSATVVTDATVYLGHSLAITVHANFAALPNMTLGVETWSSVEPSRVTFTWDAGDEGVQTEHVFADGSSTSVQSVWLVHFDHEGFFTVDISVTNQISEVTEKVGIRVLSHGPQGLQLTVTNPPAQLPSCTPAVVDTQNAPGVNDTILVFVDTEIHFEASLSAGVNITFHWLFGDAGSVTTVLPAGDNGTCIGMECTTTDMSHVFTAENGASQVKVTAANSLGELVHTILVVPVERTIEKVQFGIYGGIEAVVPHTKLAFLLSMETASRQDLHAEVDFKDGHRKQYRLQESGEYGDQCQLQMKLDHTYADEGVYTPKVWVVSPWANVTMGCASPVLIQHRLEGPSLEADSIVAVNTSAKFKLVLQVPSENKTLNWFIHRLTNEQGVGEAEEKRRVQTVVSYLQHVFAHAGQYKVAVQVTNKVSQVQTEMIVQAELPVSDLSLTSNHSRFVEVGETVTFSARVQQGSNVQFVWDFDDPNVQQTEIIYTSTESISHHKFTRIGQYSISVEASNDFNSLTVQYRETVVVEEPVLHVVVKSSGPALPGTNVTFAALVTAGSHVSFDFDFGDGRVPAANSTAAPSVSELHQYHTPGLHQVTVYAYNHVSMATGHVQVQVQQEVPALTISSLITQPIKDENAIFVVKMNDQIPEPADVLFKWTLDKEVKSYSQVPIFQHTFVAIGTHNLSVTAYNLVSRRSASASALTVVVMSSESRFDNPAIIPKGQAANFNLKGIPVGPLTLHVKYGEVDEETVEVTDGGQFGWSYQFRNARVYLVSAMCQLNPPSNRMMVNTVISVQQAVTGLTIHGPRLIPLHSVSEVFTWEARVEEGTHIVYNWSMDTTNIISANSKVWHQVLHQGLSRLQVTAFNGVSEQTASLTVSALHSISGARLSAAATVLGEPASLSVAMQGGQPWQLHVHFGDGHQATYSTTAANVSMETLVGDDNKTEYRLVIEHGYSSLGRYDVQVNISNPVSYQVLSTSVSVHQPITGLKLTTTSPSIVNTSQEVLVIATVEQGDDLTFDWHYDDVQPEVTSVNRSSTARYIFQHPDNYTISVYVSNPIYTEPVIGQLGYDIIVVQPIKMLTFEPTTGHFWARLEESNGNFSTGEVMLRARVEPTVLVMFTFNFGDGHIVRTPGMTLRGPLGDDMVGSAKHAYIKVGEFGVSVTATNLVSSVTAGEVFSVQVEPEGLQLDSVRHIQSNPMPGSPHIAHYHTLHGNATSFSASIQAGTKVTFDWKMGDGHEYPGAGSMLSHKYMGPGIYKVNVTAKNLVGQVSVQAQVNVQKYIQAVEVKASLLVHKTNTPVTFTAHTEPDLPLNVHHYEWCFEYQDNDRECSPKGARTTYDYTQEYKYKRPGRYKVMVTANNTFSERKSDPILVHTVDEIGPIILKVISGENVVGHMVQLEAYHYEGSDVTYTWTYASVGNTTTMTTTLPKVWHNFTRIGEYNITVVATNPLGSRAVKMTMFILRSPCSKPSVEILTDDQLMIPRSMEGKVEAKVSINCTITSLALYNWTLRNGNSTISLPHQQQFNDPVLLLPRRSLLYGEYTVQLRVDMNGTIVWHTAQAAFQIVPSRLMPVIRGGIQRRACRKGDVVMDATLSHDPDWPKAKDLRYEWSCYELSSPEKSCFIQNNSLLLVNDHAQPNISIPGDHFKHNEDQFVFNLTVWRPNRRKVSTTQVVQLEKELTIDVNILCDACTNGLVNADERLVMEAVHPNYSDEDVEYEWVLYTIHSLDGNEPKTSAAAHDDGSCVAADGSSYFPYTMPNSTLSPPSSRITATTLTSTTTSTSSSTTLPTGPVLPPIGGGGWPDFSADEGTGGGGRGGGRSSGRHGARRPPGGSESVPNPLEGPGTQGRTPDTGPSPESIPSPLGPGPDFPFEEGGGGGSQPNPAGRGDLFPPMEEASSPGRQGTGGGSSPAGSAGFGGFPDFGGSLGEGNPGEGGSSGGRQDHGPIGSPAGSEEGGAGVPEEGATEGHGAGRGNGSGQSGSETPVGGQGEGNGDRGTAGGPGNPASDGTKPVRKDPHIVKRLRNLIVLRNEQTTTNLTQKALVIRQDVLLQGRSHMIEVKVKHKVKQLEGSAMTYFHVNESPILGSCTVKPTPDTGGILVEMETYFQVHCIEWKDKETPIRYEVSYSLAEDRPPDLIYQGLNHLVTFRLPAGHPHLHYIVKVHIAILDILGAKTTLCSLPLTVLPKKFDTSLKSEEKILYDLVEGANSTLQTFVDKGDNRNARLHTQMVASRLNRLHPTDNTTAQTLRNSTRQAMLATLKTLPMRDEYEMHQTTSALVASTAVVEELTRESMSDASLILEKASLQMLSLSVSAKTLDQGVANITIEGTSNILQALALSHDASLTKTLVAKLTRIIKQLLKAELQTRVTGEEPVTKATTTLRAFASRYKIQSPAAIISDAASFKLPGNIRNVLRGNSKVKATGSIMEVDDSCYEAQVVTFKQNPYMYSKSQVDKVKTQVASLTLFTCRGDELEVANLTDEDHIHITIPHQQVKEPADVYQLHKHQMNLHMFNMTPANVQQSLHVDIDFAPSPEGRLFPIAVLIRPNAPPTPEEYLKKLEFGAEQQTISLHLPPGTLNESQTYYLGLVDAHYDAGRPRQGELRQRAYRFALWWGECLYWDEPTDEWSPRGCQLQGSSSYSEAHCSCNHLSSFGAHFSLAPNDLVLVDVEDFFDLHRNPVTVALIATVLIIYVILLMVCVRLDKHDEKKGHFNYLIDNAAKDKQVYIVTLETGGRKGAGTTAKVSIVLHGEEGMSETRELISETGQPLFERNSRDSFIVTLSESLGRVFKVQIWHNNAGPTPSWFLSRATVKDASTGALFYFVCEKWFAVEEDDGKVEREIMVTEGGLGFTKLLWAKGTQYLADYHLWFSTLTRPSYSRFTRAQRLTCCMCLIMSYMAVNAAWYKVSVKEYRGEFGLVDISSRSVLVGVITAVIVLPINFLIIMLFRRSKIRRYSYKDPAEKQYKSGKRESISSNGSGGGIVQPVMSGSIFDQSMLNWQSLQEWAQKTWTKHQQRTPNTSAQNIKHPSPNASTQNVKPVRNAPQESNHNQEGVDQEVVEGIKDDATESTMSMSQDTMLSELLLHSDQERGTQPKTEAPGQGQQKPGPAQPKTEAPGQAQEKPGPAQPKTEAPGQAQEKPGPAQPKTEAPGQAQQKPGPKAKAVAARQVQRDPAQPEAEQAVGQNEGHGQPGAKPEVSAKAPPKPEIGARVGARTAALEPAASTAVQATDSQTRQSKNDTQTRQSKEEEPMKDKSSKRHTDNGLEADRMLSLISEQLTQQLGALPQGHNVVSSTRGVAGSITPPSSRTSSSSKAKGTPQSPHGSPRSDRSIPRSQHSQGSQSVQSSSHKSAAQLHVSGSRPSRTLLPQFCTVLAWCLCVLVIAGCAAVTVLYGFRFGRTKSILWLQSLFFSFVQCVFITHPLLILLVTVFTAFRYRNDMSIFEHHNDGTLADSKSWLKNKQCGGEKAKLEEEFDITKGIAARQRSRYLRFARPPQEKQLIESRNKTIKEKKASAIFNETTVFVVQLLLLVFMAFTKDTKLTFALNQSFKENFVTRGNIVFEDIRTVPVFWTWVKTDFLNSLNWDTWYNGQSTDFEMSYVGNSAIVGHINLRQIRIYEETCNLPYPAFTRCRYSYDPVHETRLPYGTNQTWYHVNSDVTGAGKIDGKHASYGGNGYLVLLNTNRTEAFRQLQSLEVDGWIDQLTRAVVLEFTLFHPPTSIFTSVTLLLEVPPVGGATTTHRIASAHVYKYMTGLDNVVLTCELLFIVATLLQLHFVLMDVMRLRSVYIRSVWSCVEMTQIVLSLVFIACFIYRFILVGETVEELRATYHQVFVDVSPVHHWDCILATLVGCVLFLVMMRLLKALQYRRPFATYCNVYRHAAMDLLVFALMFVVWTCAYTSVGLAVFMAVSPDFRGLDSALGSTMGLMTRHHHQHSVDTGNHWGLVSWRLFIVSFLICALGSLSAYIIAVLNFHYKVYKDEPVLVFNTLETISYYWYCFRHFFGLIQAQLPQEDDNLLPPEFTMAEIEYQVDEMLFKMNALSGTSNLPEKPPMYFTDSDATTYGVGEDAISSGGSEVRAFDEDKLEHRIQKIEDSLFQQEPHLAQLLQLDAIGALDALDQEKEKQLRAQLELEIFRQLQMQRQDHQYLSSSDSAPYNASLPSSTGYQGDSSNQSPQISSQGGSSSSGSTGQDSGNSSPAGCQAYHLPPQPPLASRLHRLAFPRPPHLGVLSPPAEEVELEDLPGSECQSHHSIALPAERTASALTSVPDVPHRDALVLQDISEQGSLGTESGIPLKCLPQLKDVPRRAARERFSLPARHVGLAADCHCRQSSVSSTNSSGGAEVHKVLQPAGHTHRTLATGADPIPKKYCNESRSHLCSTSDKLKEDGGHGSIAGKGMSKGESSMSDEEQELKSTRSANLRKTKSRGKGKGLSHHHAGAAGQAQEEFAFDNKGYSSDSDPEVRHANKSTGHRRSKSPRKECWS